VHVRYSAGASRRARAPDAPPQRSQFTMSAKPSRTPSSAWTVTSATSWSSRDEALPSDAARAFSMTPSAVRINPVVTGGVLHFFCRVLSEQAPGTPLVPAALENPP